MKLVKLLTLGISIAACSAMADDLTFTPKPEEFACAKGVYCVEQMFCLGTIVGQPPKEMHPDYYISALSFRSFKSAKNVGGGQKVLVDSLLINDASAGENVSFEQAYKDAIVNGNFDYGWYGPSARVKGKTVTVWGGLFSLGFKFRIISSKTEDGKRIDTLTGQETTSGSVVGSYKRDYKCEAWVVEKPTKMVDNTKKSK